MRGIVVARNIRIDRIYILVDHDCTLTYFDTSWCQDFEEGDAISGDLQTLGYEELYNHDQQFKFHGTAEFIFERPKPVYLPYFEKFSSHPERWEFNTPLSR